MILQRLYELAQRENLLDDPAFEELPVPYVVLVGEGGEYLGLNEQRGETVIPSKKKGGEPKRVPDKGKLLKVPRPHGNTANQGFARYFVDTFPRVLPLVVEAKDQPKADASRATFWKQIDRAADENDDPALKAIQSFGRRLDEFAERIRADVVAKDPALTDRVTFAYRESGGPTILDNVAVRTWYSAIYAGVNSAKQDAGPVGLCQVTGRVGPIPRSHPNKLQGVPGGMAVGVSLISFDKPAFEHYGLDGAANAAIGYAAAEGYLRALDSLLKDNLPSVKAKGGKSRIRVGGTAFLYWTKEKGDTSFMWCLEEPMEALIKSLYDGKNVADVMDAEPFYLLALSGNAARAIVRGYLETKLGEAKANVAKWFDDLRIADTSKDFAGTPNDKFPIWMLARATAFDSDAVAPDTGEHLLQAALTGGPVPETILAACVKRLRAEGGAGCRPERMALMKLCLNRSSLKENPMPPTLDVNRSDLAYCCGRLLAFLARCQNPRDFGTSAQLLDRYFSTASTSPRSVFPTLLRLNRHHISKVRDDNRGFAFNLEQELEERLAPFKSEGDVVSDFPALLSLPEQGQFALGFYHQRAAYRNKPETDHAEAK